ncbi:hypothetical protein SERLA73DRAFT_175287 [Serpula lacrymans var. lacrymans S7.3]|uniref:DUF2855 family protein n=2 Tax=Serpula lacrymans var. lacrymans TaxID=341189 RepID=F8PIR2_SERL3|nr:uncharacterized protein SERLADRAFT_457478 [Serpula lacrymans var. lacrymans S7.9]EGO03695.1 hypothetical protein SERLA73DRAFT_175287 [Serpula lacrymans var. lacrymans S7.3]EGO29558.1 hypothetical protein SERLADRAFT_457478 [Serpula lacrymans var. lacrymans S7.9]
MTSTDDNLTLCHPRPSSGQNPNQAIVVVSPTPSKLPPNHVLIKVDRFGFSANNVTYQALGEAPHFRYFDFHPTPEIEGVSPKTHGITPVWGFGTVVKSSHPKIHIGERVYGYLSPSRYLLLPVSPSDVNKYAFSVPRPHLPADRRPYNQITRCSSDPLYNSSPAVEDLTMLYRPLFWTSFWCEDWLFRSGYGGGATRILISSASSKTAFCLAYLIRKRIKSAVLPGTRIVGLTSRKNVDFTRRLSLYDDVLDYDSFISSSVMRLGGDKWVYADVAGNDSLNSNVFSHFGDGGHLVKSVALGLTNLSPSSPGASSTKWSKNEFQKDTKPHRPSDLEQFFMPEWLAVRRNELSVAEITGMQKIAWNDLMRDCVNWVTLCRVCGREDVKRAYDDVVKRGLGPEEGLIWSLWEGQNAKDESSPSPKL